MNTLSLRTLVRNAAAVFSHAYGAVTRQAEQLGCSRQTLYNQAREVERRLQLPAPGRPPAPDPVPTPTPPIDRPTLRRVAVTAFAMGISTRQIEELLGVIQPHAPDHSTIARWVADEAEKAKPILEVLDSACVPLVRTLAVAEGFF